MILTLNPSLYSHREVNYLGKRISFADSASVKLKDIAKIDDVNLGELCYLSFYVSDQNGIEKLVPYSCNKWPDIPPRDELSELLEAVEVVGFTVAYSGTKP